MKYICYIPKRKFVYEVAYTTVKYVVNPYLKSKLIKLIERCILNLNIYYLYNL